jgi:hypothetical protein
MTFFCGREIPFLGAKCHQVLVGAGFVAVLKGFKGIEENDGRSSALKVRGIFPTCVSDLSQRFFDALCKSPTILAL